MNPNNNVYDEEQEGQSATKPDLPGLRVSEGVDNDTAGRESGGATSGTGGGRNARFSSGSSTGGSRSSRASGIAGNSTAGTGHNADSDNTTGSNTGGGVGVRNLASAEEAAGLYKANSPFSNSTGRVKRLMYSNKKKRYVLGGSLAGLTVAGAIAIFSIVQGPMQFVQFSQLLQKFHFSSNEDFGDDRTSKVLIYALLNKGAERGRLGVAANKAADKWEAKLLEETGLRPIYTKDTRRFVGFEIVDQDKADAFVGSSADRSKGIERTMGKGASITTVDEARGGRGQLFTRGGSSGTLEGKTKIVDLSSVKSYAERARFIHSIGKATDTSKLVSSIGSHLLTKRVGVSFHLLDNAQRKAGDKAADWKQEYREKRAKEDSNGVKPQTVGVQAGEDADGNPNATAEDIAASGEANEAIEEVADSIGKNTIKDVAGKIGGGTAAAVGVMCAARSLGDNIVDYKYANNALPMLRMGMHAISTGAQVMAAFMLPGQDVNMDELGALNEAFFDPADGSSAMAANSIKANLGEKQNGVDIPPEASLKNVGNKPALFNAIDQIPILGTACGALDAVSNLPVIKQVSGAVSSVMWSTMTVPAQAIGVDPQGLLEDALAAVAGKGVDTLAQGGTYGALADTGAFLASSQSSLTMGGAPLTTAQTVGLKEEQQTQDRSDQQYASFTERYLDPLNTESLVASVFQRAPPVSSNANSLANNTASLFSSGFASLFSGAIPSVSAASVYDYGIPKYGWSQQDRDDTRFEDPYENADYIETTPGLLDSLNDQYGEKCFGMTVTAGSDGGIQINSDSMGSENLNIFKIRAKHPDCDPANNSDLNFLRYRFYLADSMTAASLACNEGDDSYCQMLGMESSSSSTSDSSSSSDDSSGTATGSTKELAQQLLDSKNVTPQTNPASSLRAAANGEKSPAGIDKCGTQHPPVAIDAKLLGFLVDLSKEDAFTITSLTTGAHACDSNHYKGVAVDFGCDLDTSIADRIGKKYGISHNFESCSDAIPHWHYSIGGN
jgi:hypothetical protein